MISLCIHLSAINNFDFEFIGEEAANLADCEEDDQNDDALRDSHEETPISSIRSASPKVTNVLKIHIKRINQLTKQR